MTYDARGQGALDYLPCRYGMSRLLFRGPKSKLDHPYLAFIGGTETYGRFIADPFVHLVQKKTGICCANFGYINAGTDVLFDDPFIQDAISNANGTVIQIVGTQNTTNRFYTVHPRRNDRFVAPSVALKRLFPEVDFAEFHFNKHLLQTLRRVSVSRFEVVRQELQASWVSRMQERLKKIHGKTILLWFCEPQAAGSYQADSGLGCDPLFVTRAMIEDVRPHVDKLVYAVPSQLARQEGIKGMVFNPLEAHIAREMPGVRAHIEAAETIVGALKEIL